MKCYTHIMILTVTITASFTTAAQQVYQNVDQQGVVEFSDQPSAGANAVDVRPNVVDVAPVKPIVPSPSASPSGGEKAPAVRVRTEVNEEGVAGDYYDDRNSRLERKKRMERGEKPVRQPVRKMRQRAVHEGAVRR